MCPSLNLAKGSLGGVSIGNKLFAIGGGNGIESFSDVEMLDMDLGRWICTRSMLQRVIGDFGMFVVFNFRLIHLYDNSIHSVKFGKYDEQISLKFSFGLMVGYWYA